MIGELAASGLRVKEMDADGHCFFRSLADQLEGDTGNHRLFRKNITDYMAEHKEVFEPFLEDEEDWDVYLNRMKADAWAGNLELQAASMLLRVNIRIYQEDQPVWTIKNFPDGSEEHIEKNILNKKPDVKTTPTLHLSYHDGCHYNSVRLASDYGKGPPHQISDTCKENGAATGPAPHAQEGDDTKIGCSPGPPPMKKKLGKNRPCPCGSHLKYKNCCGSTAAVVAKRCMTMGTEGCIEDQQRQLEELFI